MLAELLGALRCQSCGAPGDLFCAGCRSEAPPAKPLQISGADSAAALWHWGGAPRNLVLGLKLRAQRSYAVPLGRAVAQVAWRAGTLAEAITWVPGRPRDIRSRGFDHAECIARQASLLLGLPAVRLLCRSRSPKDQVGLSRIERLSNQSSGDFVAQRAASVLLVDDLVTTGATVISCVEALRRAGATRIEVAAPCRA